MELWKKYIIWEKSNPLNTEDTALITRRVMFAFDQALLCMTHHPDFWYEAAQFLDGSSKILLEKGVRVLKYFIFFKHYYNFYKFRIYQQQNNIVMKHPMFMKEQSALY